MSVILRDCLEKWWAARPCANKSVDSEKTGLWTLY